MTIRFEAVELVAELVPPAAGRWPQQLQRRFEEQILTLHSDE